MRGAGRLLVAKLGRWYVKALKSVIASLFAGLVVTAFYQVVSRYALGRTPAWTEEAARYLAVWVVLLTSALAIEFGGHVTVDLLLTRLPRRVRLLTTSVGWASILLFLGVFVYQSVQLLGVAAGQVTPGLGIPMVWVYTILPLAGTCMLISSSRAAWDFVRREFRGLSKPPRA
jgi:TRAP-type C4-dicarboxylate transport system permease small subunit